MLKVVLDTNLIVSAFITSNGYPAQILKAWRDGVFELVISPQIIEEMRRILFLDRIKKRRFLSDEEVNTFLSELRNIKGFIEPQTAFEVIKEDPDDDKLLIAGVEGKVDYIVSGDYHLRDLKSYQEIKIVSPAEFIPKLFIKW